MSTDIVVSDLDGTLCDTAHRYHLAPEKPDLTSTVIDRALWIPFSMACYGDGVIEGVAQTLRLLSDTFPIFFVSHRAEEAFALTSAWLHEVAEVPFDSLRLHRESDAADGPTFKADYIQELRADGYNPILYFDDWVAVCRAVMAVGVPTVCVNPMHTEVPPWMESKL